MQDYRDYKANILFNLLYYRNQDYKATMSTLLGLGPGPVREVEMLEKFSLGDPQNPATKKGG